MIIFDINTYKGLNNTSTDFRMVGKASYLKSAVNVDITDEGTIKSRYTPVSVTTGNISNLYSDKNALYFTDNHILWKLDGNSELISSVYTFPYIPLELTYARCGDLLFASDGNRIFCVEGTLNHTGSIFYNLRPMPAGKLLSMSGRLYSIVDKTIYYSEPYSYLYYDTMNVYTMPSTVTVAKSAGDYICLSTETDTRIITDDQRLVIVLHFPSYAMEYIDTKSYSTSPQYYYSKVILCYTPEGFFAVPNSGNPIAINDKYRNTGLMDKVIGSCLTYNQMCILFKED